LDDDATATKGGEVMEIGYFIVCMIVSYLFYKAWQEKKKCCHDWKIIKISNVLQLDDMGYPLRLCIFECSKCGKSEQMWIDVPVGESEELKDGKSVLVKWTGVHR
jgi:hypothetical protein